MRLAKDSQTVAGVGLHHKIPDEPSDIWANLGCRFSLRVCVDVIDEESVVSGDSNEQRDWLAADFV